MTKQVLNELTSLINEFNIGKYDDEYRYEMTKPMMYKRGRYSVNIRYKIFFTLDMNELMRFAVKNELLVSLLYSNVTGKPYMAIQ